MRARRSVGWLRTGAPFVALLACACTERVDSWGVKLGADSVSGVVVDRDGGVTVALSAGGKVGAIQQYTSDGERRFLQHLDFDVSGLAPDADGSGFVVVGRRSIALEQPESLVARIDGREITWSTPLTTTSEEGVETELLPRYVLSDEAGIWVAGQEERVELAPSLPNPGPSLVRPFLARLDADGELSWLETIGQSSAIYPLGLALDGHGGVVLGVRLNGADLEIAGDVYERSQLATLLIGFSGDGEARFTRDIGESPDDEMTSLGRGEDGRLHVTGERTRHDLGNLTANGVFLVVASADGDVELRADFDQGIQMEEPRVAARPGGGFVIASNYSDHDGGGHLLLLDLDTAGDELRRRTFPKGGYSTDVAVSPDGDVLLFGSFQEEIEIGPVQLDTEQAYDAFLVRLRD